MSVTAGSCVSYRLIAELEKHLVTLKRVKRSKLQQHLWCIEYLYRKANVFHLVESIRVIMKSVWLVSFSVRLKNSEVVPETPFCFPVRKTYNNLSELLKLERQPESEKREPINKIWKNLFWKDVRIHRNQVLSHLISWCPPLNDPSSPLKYNILTVMSTCSNT